jgi:diadenosine tetraphosphatase ApaH/serine/threonine PP2A family protein phosphatase
LRYLLLSDIHANLQALEAVLSDADGLGYDATLVLGDLVGYGADPAAVIDRTLALSPTAIIRGNHDKVAAGLEPASLFNDVARQSIEWTASVLSPGHLQTLVDLPKGPRPVGTEIEICHGSPFDEDYYLFDTADAGRAMESTASRICFFGHTHLPAIYATAQDPVRSADGLEEDELLLPETGPALINVGSVGQPRDGDPRAAYGIVDLERNVLRLRRVRYDVAGAQTRIREEKLPEYLAARLAKGQ